MYSIKIALTMQYRGNNIKNANLDPCEISNFIIFYHNVYCSGL